MEHKYQALVAKGKGVLEFTEKKSASPAAGEVLIAVEACGICHTDSFTVEHGFPGLTLPRVPGHEVIGTIIETGAGISPHWIPGMRVGVGFLAGYCEACPACRAGDFVNCEDQPKTGIHRDGGYAELMAAKQTALVEIPEGLSGLDAAPLLCAGITTFNALRKSGVKPGQRVAVQGVGGLGHLAIQYARKMGLETVAIARGKDKQPLALALGAHHYIDSKEFDAAEALKSLGGADVIIATASAPVTFGHLINGLNRHGSLVILGAGVEPVTFDVSDLLAGEKTITGVLTGSAFESEGMLKFSLLNKVRSINEVIEFKDALSGYQRMMENKARFRVIIKMPNPERFIK